MLGPHIKITFRHLWKSKLYSAINVIGLSIGISCVLQEEHWQQVIRAAAILSMAICSLGLFGLAHLSTNQRIKEIGVRKILGASVREIVALLAGDFLKLVLIAFIIATPIAWLVMYKWLQEFAYRISMGAGFFILAGLISTGIAFIVVSFQSIMGAIANPVTSLRSE